MKSLHVCKKLWDSDLQPHNCGSFLLVFQVSSSICLLRGKIYDAMGNRPLATSSYKEALKLDVYCFEAFDLLTSHHMLTAQEGEVNATAINFQLICSFLFIVPVQIHDIRIMFLFNRKRIS